MRFTDIFISRPVLATVVSLLILFLGLRAFFDLPVRQYPKLENTVITITTSYPGASPDLMQGFITQPIEQAVSAAEGLDYLTSSSTQGTSTISAYVKLNFDPNKAMTEVMAKVQQVKYLIPKESNDPIIVKATGETIAIMYIGFASPELSSPAISDYLSRVVQPLIATVDGVASADILGGQVFAMRIWLNPDKMAARGVSAQDISAAIAANNFQAAPGQTKGYFTITNVVANTGLTDIEQFRNMVVKAQNGALVRLRDVAMVELGAQSTDSSVWMNGEHAVFVGVQATPTGNPLNIVKGVRALIPTLERSLPPTVKMAIPYDSTKFIQASIDEVVHTLALAVGIVIVVIFLFLGSIRSVAIPVVTIPLSLIGACVVMLGLGFSMNLLTLLAMVLAIGLVVDDAIVVVENIYRHIEEGKTPVQSAIIGAREIVGPVIAMTITLAAVYAPIGFLTGLTGSLFREFAFTLAGSVIISGIIALTLSPMMCSMLLKHHNPGGFAGVIDKVFDATTRWYGRRLDRSLDYRPVVLLFAAVILGTVYFLFTHSKAELAPAEDQGVIFALAKGPQYANLDYTEAYARQIDGVYSSFPETFTRFVVNGRGGVNQGFSGFVMKPWSERSRTAMQMLPLAQQKLSAIDGLNVFAFGRPPLPGTQGGLPVQMVINAPADFRTVYDTMDRIKAEARNSGLFIVTDSDLEFNNPVVRVHVDHAKANDLGITMQSVAGTLATMLGGNYVNRFDLNGRSYRVIPQVPRIDRLTPAALGNYYIKTASGDSVPLSTIASVATGTDPNALTHYNQLNAATFSAVPMPGVTMGQAVGFLEATAAKILPPEFNHAYLSESRQYVTEGSQLAITFAFALIIIFLVLAAQFESMRDPLVILVSVPMSICGALLPLFFGLATLNIYTEVGLVTLIGLISKHGILMVSFANDLQRNEKLDKRSAIARAARVRLRPILMTTAAMVVGLVPLLVATGAGASSRFSIGVVIVAGMSIGTLFTLFVLPAVYTLFAKDHRPEASAARTAEIEAVS
ncbi:MAG TPA: MexW/MexI family multidrug efflux RND transporter permease subunit [Alphaproteobacteria bacterium]|nr:MexW/MexI family multidrug efflux RND transporter permease subunit [Alphaproteobacteria bacterium]